MGFDRRPSFVVVLVGANAWSHRERLAHAHVLLAVDEQRVVLDGEVVFERRLRAQQVLQRVLRLAQRQLQTVDRLRDLVHLRHQSTTHTGAASTGRMHEAPTAYLSLIDTMKPIVVCRYTIALSTGPITGSM